ncbi:component of small subunit processosome extracellular mutant DEAH-box protein [Mitosporidium daphniae]|uniref:RNA helicase n=1 Tax=Mitosporidium daphniae TaxID=1485682 RepID=A0A098VPX2_9MICR|nr:component of small subunit processosome extracellular mutant DEAH-box protein [Mitosporidium daphniae]KGG50839.1 component of small subunit processosome extracellular mutant DEAH-box protein [Mitosporidium daphniae]|eukprot:XP_013237266.1 component of small subunit processosome extracellular mutant DEAH-box protein [Mitosporidium daphniae]
MKTDAKRARLLAQYTHKKLLKEEKQTLLEGLANEHKKRKELLAKYELQKKNISSSSVSSKRAVREALYTKAIEETHIEDNRQNCFKQELISHSSLEVERVSSSGEDDWDGFLDPPKEIVEKNIHDPQDFTAGSAPLTGASLFRIFNRLPKVEEDRSSLPILSEEQSIVEMIRYNDISFICGETGSGKTTQLPQFLLESGFADPSSSLFPGKIIVTQPRRVAAMSMAARVAHELNEEGIVGYQVRYDSTQNTEATRVIFMTDGILLRIIANDFLLSAYSVIILDEAHERSVNTDLLLGLLTRIVALRRKKFDQVQGSQGTPLKLVIMSATLQMEEPELENEKKVADLVQQTPSMSLSPQSTLFRGLARPPPFIDIPSRQFPIHIHYSKKTPTDMLSEAYRKVLQIHKKLPAGGILVFVTGQDEVWSLIDRLRGNKTRKGDRPTVLPETINDPLSMDDRDDRSAEPEYHSIVDANNTENNDRHGNESEDISEDEELHPRMLPPMRVLPFYSLLPYAEQEKVLTASCSLNDSERLVIVATNLAETSLTIPGVSYVVDTGRVKRRTFDGNGVESYSTSWISKASARQRAGRAGRTGPGHVYRLYSSSLFEDLFDDFDTPEILHMVLQMKAMNIDNVAHFPFPTAPDPVKLEQGERLLLLLGALSTPTAVVTEIGRGMALFPVPDCRCRSAGKLFAAKKRLRLGLDSFRGKSFYCWKIPRDHFRTCFCIYIFFKAFQSYHPETSSVHLSPGATSMKRLRSQLGTIISRSFVKADALEPTSEPICPKDVNSIWSQLISLFLLAHPDCIAKRVSSPGKMPVFLPVGLATCSTIRLTSPISTWISFITMPNEKNEAQICKAKPDTSSIFSTASFRNKKLGGWFVYGRIRQHLDTDRMGVGKISLSILSEIPDPTLLPEHLLKLFSSNKLT